MANFGAPFFSSKFDFSTGNYENMQKRFPSCFFFLLFLALETLLLTFWTRFSFPPKTHPTLKAISTQSSFAHACRGGERKFPYPHARCRKSSPVFTNPVCDSSLYLLFSKRLCYMLKTGTLSYQEFENELLDFIERAKNIQDSWNVEFPKVRSLRTVAVWAQGLIQSYMPSQLNV